MIINQEIQESAGKLQGWMILHGMLFIVPGALYTLTIIGAIFGIPLLIAGVSLIKAAGNFSKVAVNADEAELLLALKNQGLFFKIIGILSILSFLIPFLLLILVFGAALLSPESFDVEQYTQRLPQLQLPSGAGIGKEV